MVNKKSSRKNNKKYTRDDLKKIRRSLVNQKSKIIEELMVLNEDSLRKSSRDASGDLSGYSFHMADMATDQYDREFLLSLAEGEREILYTLDDAIKKIDEGTYGTCDMCGEIISKQRLKAMPQAQYCIKCQEKKEKSSGR